MFTVEHTTYRVGGQALLKEASVAFRRGRLTAVVGPNGAGKSTLLHLLVGLRKAQTGSIRYQGSDLNDWRPSALAKSRVLLAQRFVCPFDLSGGELVLLGRIPYAKWGPRRDDERIALECMIETDCLALRDRSIATLSGGERQRVLWARAAAQVHEAAQNGHATFLLDEPLAGLDVRHQHELLTLARRWTNRGNTVVVVLHDIAMAVQYADDLAFLRGGRLLRHGPLAEVLDEEILAEVFDFPLRLLRTGSGRLHVYTDAGHQPQPVDHRGAPQHEFCHTA